MTSYMGTTFTDNEQGDLQFRLNEVRETQIWETDDYRYVITLESIHSGSEHFGYDWTVRKDLTEIASGHTDGHGLPGGNAALDAVWAVWDAMKALKAAGQ